MIKSWLPELWSSEQPITNFATGIKATDEMKEDSLNIKERGATARVSFIKELPTKENKDAYYSTIKRQPIKLFEKKGNTKKQGIPSDESQSFTEIFALFDQKTLDLRKNLEWPVTSTPWAIVNEDLKSRQDHKHLFKKSLQLMSPIGAKLIAPNDIKITIVNGMRVVRLIKVTALNTNTFKCWANNFISYLKGLPGSTLHLFFYDYKYEYSVPSKLRDKGGIERDVNDIHDFFL